MLGKKHYLSFLGKFGTQCECFIRLVKFKGSYLYTTGWVEAIKSGYPCDENGDIIPWMNYPVVSFLKDRIDSKMTVFEFGSGYSTIYFSKIVKHIDSVESNEEWYKLITSKLDTSNTNVLKVPLDINGAYCRSINETGRKYNLVLIDGGDRVNATIQSYERLSEDGVIILDDSERSENLDIHFLLKNKGFRSITFDGLKPLLRKSFSTTIFYRSKNCLNI